MDVTIVVRAFTSAAEEPTWRGVPESTASAAGFPDGASLGQQGLDLTGLVQYFIAQPDRPQPADGSPLPEGILSPRQTSSGYRRRTARGHEGVFAGSGFLPVREKKEASVARIGSFRQVVLAPRSLQACRAASILVRRRPTVGAR